MSGRLLLLCPGQGGQHSGMFDMARGHPRAAALVDACALPGSETDMFANRIAQPAIVAATLAMWEAIRDQVPAPALVAGYSIGELSAYAVAGALTPPDAIKLASERARLMDACVARGPAQALVAASGIRLPDLANMIVKYGFQLAIVTGDDSVICGGLMDGVAGFADAVLAAGGRLQQLPVGIASHTNWMSEAVAPFAAALRAAPLRAPLVPVLSGIGAIRVQQAELAIEHLSRQLAEPIQWSDCMDACAEAGIGVALELGPGAALTRMLQARHPEIACRSVSDFRSIDGILKWLERHFN